MDKKREEKRRKKSKTTPKQRPNAIKKSPAASREKNEMEKCTKNKIK
jgi:hypothetical protein